MENHKFQEVELVPSETGYVLPTNYDESQMALSVLNQSGYQSKIFCHAQRRAEGSSFVIEGQEWNWNVVPLNRKNIEEVPQEYLRGIVALQNNQIKIERIAIAKPIPKENVSSIIKEEVQREAKKLAMFFVNTLFIVVKIISSVGVSSRSVSGNIAFNNMIDLSDPVLLVKVQNKWIEIGRWE